MHCNTLDAKITKCPVGSDAAYGVRIRAVPVRLWKKSIQKCRVTSCSNMCGTWLPYPTGSNCTAVCGVYSKREKLWPKVKDLLIGPWQKPWLLPAWPRLRSEERRVG